MAPVVKNMIGGSGRLTTFWVIKCDSVPFCDAGQESHAMAWKNIPDSQLLRQLNIWQSSKLPVYVFPPSLIYQDF